jgi:SAM-dependent methyltransferase
MPPPAPDRHLLRRSFEEVPELYDRARPGYPPQLFDDLVELAGLRPGDRVLEIGCGTGQATQPLAERGLRLTCIELGAGMVAFVRRRLARFPEVEIVQGLFETWVPERAEFDAIVAFTSFHWLDPDAQYEKSARLLRPAGALALGRSDTVLLDDHDPFWVDVREDYDAVVPSHEYQPPPRPDELGDYREQIDGSGRFRTIDVSRYLWELTYSAEEFVALLETYSGHRSIEEPQRSELYRRIRRRIDVAPGGRVRRTYVSTLHVARRS